MAHAGVRFILFNLKLANQFLLQCHKQDYMVIGISTAAAGKIEVRGMKKQAKVSVTLSALITCSMNSCV